MGIEHAHFEEAKRLSLVTVGEIVSIFVKPKPVKLGSCKITEEIIIGEDKLSYFSIVALGEACTIALRGAAQQILDEANRSFHDCKRPCKQLVAIEAFAHGLTQLPTITPNNAGFDSSYLVSQLQAARIEGKSSYRLDTDNACIADTAPLGTTECFQVKPLVVLSAAEVAGMILQADDMKTAKQTTW